MKIDLSIEKKVFDAAGSKLLNTKYFTDSWLFFIEKKTGIKQLIIIF